MLIRELLTPSFVAEGTRVEGSLVFCAPAHILGTVEGDLCQQAYDCLEIGAQGWVHGNISSVGPVRVDGRVEGNIHSQTSIHLGPCAKVIGTLVAPKVEVEPGARLEAEIMMQQAKSLSNQILRAA